MAPQKADMAFDSRADSPLHQWRHQLLLKSTQQEE